GDPRLLAVETPTFKGNLLAVGQLDYPASATGAGGVEFWDVGNPNYPRLLGRLPALHGVSSFDLVQREGRLFALLAVNVDEIWVADVTDFTRPMLLSIWQPDPDIVRNVRRGISLDTSIPRLRRDRRRRHLHRGSLRSDAAERPRQDVVRDG